MSLMSTLTEPTSLFKKVTGGEVSLTVRDFRMLCCAGTSHANIDNRKVKEYREKERGRWAVSETESD